MSRCLLVFVVLCGLGISADPAVGDIEIDYVFVIDASNSMNDYIEDVSDAIEHFVGTDEPSNPGVLDQYDVDARFAIVLYGDGPDAKDEEDDKGGPELIMDFNNAAGQPHGPTDVNTIMSAVVCGGPSPGIHRDHGSGQDREPGLEGIRTVLHGRRTSAPDSEYIYYGSGEPGDNRDAWRPIVPDNEPELGQPWDPHYDPIRLMFRDDARKDLLFFTNEISRSMVTPFFEENREEGQGYEELPEPQGLGWGPYQLEIDNTFSAISEADAYLHMVLDTSISLYGNPENDVPGQPGDWLDFDPAATLTNVQAWQTGIDPDFECLQGEVLEAGLLARVGDLDDMKDEDYHDAFVHNFFTSGVLRDVMLTSVDDGQWDETPTWDDGYRTPDAWCDTTILDDTVTLSTDGAARSLLIDDPEGSLTIESGNTLTVVKDPEDEDPNAGVLTVNGGTLTVDGTLVVDELSVIQGGTIVVEYEGPTRPTVDGPAMIGLDSSTGTLDIKAESGLDLTGDFEMNAQGVYAVELARPGNGFVNVTAANSAAFPNGTLSLTAVGNISDPMHSQDPEHPELGGFGEHTRVVIDLTQMGEGSIEGAFQYLPADNEHLGYGVLYDRKNIPPATIAGVTYDDEELGEVRVHLFQAAYGDVDGNRKVDIFDILKIKVGPHGYGKPGPAEWTDGDMVGQGLDQPADGEVRIHDILAIKLCGQFGAGPYRGMSGGGDRLGGDCTVSYDSATGEMFLDNGPGIETLFLASETGLFIPETADPAIGEFVQLDDEYLYGAISLTSILADGSMGLILPSGLSEAAFLADISVDQVIPESTPVELVYLTGGRMEGKSFEALPAPEPETLVMLAFGVLALLAFSRSRRLSIENPRS